MTDGKEKDNEDERDDDGNEVQMEGTKDEVGTDGKTDDDTDRVGELRSLPTEAVDDGCRGIVTVGVDSGLFPRMATGEKLQLLSAEEKPCSGV